MDLLKIWSEFCLSFPGVYRDYPFGEEWTVFRHRGNKKAFAFFYERGGVLRVNLKCDPFRADLLRSSFSWVTPGYHMNKTHWNTVCLSDAVGNEDEVRSMIAHSFSLTAEKKSKKKGEAEVET